MLPRENYEEYVLSQADEDDVRRFSFYLSSTQPVYCRSVLVLGFRPSQKQQRAIRKVSDILGSEV